MWWNLRATHTHFLEVAPDAANLQNHTEINPLLTCNLPRIFDFWSSDWFDLIAQEWYSCTIKCNFKTFQPFFYFPFSFPLNFLIFLLFKLGRASQTWKRFHQKPIFTTVEPWHMTTMIWLHTYFDNSLVPALTAEAHKQNPVNPSTPLKQLIFHGQTVDKLSLILVTFIRHTVWSQKPFYFIYRWKFICQQP